MWRESAELLRRCLSALQGQQADQVIVARSSEAQSPELLAAEFPHVQWIEHRGALDLPGLQWLALAEACGEMTAFLEAPSAPGPGWVAAHRQAHLAHPEVLACGGPIRLPRGASSWELGWYWSDYAAYPPGRPSGKTRDLTDANVSYKTQELRAHESLLAAKAWGWRIRLASAQDSYYESSAWIDYRCPHRLGVALRQRRSAGSAHGAALRPSVAGRALAILTAPLLPFVLAWRGWQRARSAGHRWSYLRALPWVLVFHLWWTCGEAVGMWSGRRSSY